METYDFEAGGRALSLKVLDTAEIKPCGECRACCTTIGVRELKKNNYQPCEFECDAGCSRYDTRPPSCREYLCWFKVGFVDKRPDRLGLIFDFDSVAYVIRVWEVSPGAASSADGLAAIAQLKRKWPGIGMVVIDEALGRSAPVFSEDHPYWKAAAQIFDVNGADTFRKRLTAKDRADQRRKARKRAKASAKGREVR